MVFDLSSLMNLASVTRGVESGAPINIPNNYNKPTGIVPGGGIEGSVLTTPGLLKKLGGGAFGAIGQFMGGKEDAPIPQPKPQTGPAGIGNPGVQSPNKDGAFGGIFNNRKPSMWSQMDGDDRRDMLGRIGMGLMANSSGKSTIQALGESLQDYRNYRDDKLRYEREQGRKDQVLDYNKEKDQRNYDRDVLTSDRNHELDKQKQKLYKQSVKDKARQKDPATEFRDKALLELIKGKSAFGGGDYDEVNKIIERAYPVQQYTPNPELNTMIDRQVKSGIPLEDVMDYIQRKGLM